MPIFVYRCDCGHRFERLVPREADAPACPECGGVTRKVPAGPSLRRAAQAPAARTAAPGRRWGPDPVARSRQRWPGEAGPRGRVPAAARGQGRPRAPCPRRSRRGARPRTRWHVQRPRIRRRRPRPELRARRGRNGLAHRSRVPADRDRSRSRPGRDFAQAAEGLGYAHLLVFDHVLGAGFDATRPDWNGALRRRDLFHEPFVLFGYLAGLTQRLELVTGVIVLPQRQTALVAKQAAEVDVLCRGACGSASGSAGTRVEYEALGQAFSDRGSGSTSRSRSCARCSPRRPSTSPATATASATPASTRCPSSGPIPIWFGGMSEAAHAPGRAVGRRLVPRRCFLTPQRGR